MVQKLINGKMYWCVESKEEFMSLYEEFKKEKRKREEKAKKNVNVLKETKKRGRPPKKDGVKTVISKRDRTKKKTKAINPIKLKEVAVKNKKHDVVYNQIAFVL